MSCEATAFSSRSERADRAQYVSPEESGNMSDEGLESNAEKIAHSILSTTTESLSLLDKETSKRFPKQSIVLLGNTGAGKTTVAYALAGREFRVYRDESYGEIILRATQEMEGFAINDSMKSQTTIPRICVAQDKQRKISIIDMPGFRDNRGIGREISNAVCTARIFEKYSGAKILLVVEEDSLIVERGEGILALITTIDEMCSHKISKIGKSLSLVVTKAVLSEEAIKESLDDVGRRKDLSSSKKKILAELQKRIVIFEKPTVDQVGSTFYATEVAKRIFSHIHETKSIGNSHVTYTVSDRGTRVISVICGALERDVMQHATQFAESFLDSLERYVRRCITNYSTSGQAKRSDIEEQLQKFLQRLHVKSRSRGVEKIDALLDACFDVMKWYKARPVRKHLLKVHDGIDLVSRLGGDVSEADKVKRHLCKEGYTFVHGKIQEACTILQSVEEDIEAICAREEAERNRIRRANSERQAKKRRERERVARRHAEIAKQEQDAARRREQEEHRRAAAARQRESEDNWYVAKIIGGFLLQGTVGALSVAGKIIQVAAPILKVLR